MAIQVLPIIKALAPVISTAGSIYSEWQRHRRTEGDPPPQPATGEPPRELAERLGALEARTAENAHLISQVAQQLEQTALQLEEAGRLAERNRRTLRRLSWATGLLALVVVGLLVMSA